MQSGRARDVSFAFLIRLQHPRSLTIYKLQLDFGARSSGTSHCELWHSGVAISILQAAELVRLQQVCSHPVKEVDSLEDTARGEGGFGSTGVSESK